MSIVDVWKEKHIQNIERSNFSEPNTTRLKTEEGG